MTDSLFGHLASRFTSSPENLATESLLYVLQRSPTARNAFLHYLEQTGCEPFPEGLRLVSQNSDEDQAIPDLAGLDADNHPRFLCEVKFWAGLTENQPITYLKRLIKASGSLLVVLAPSKRFPTLWPELVRRTKDANFKVEPLQVSRELETVRVNEKYTLALASWRSVLGVLARALETEGDVKTLSDLMQLQGLCDRMDSDAFRPLRSEELTADTGQRIRQYCDLVDESAAKLGAAGIVKLEGLRASGSRGWYGRYVFMHEYGCLLQFNANFLAKYGQSPLWFSIQGTEEKHWGYSPEAREKLSQLEMEEPPRLFVEGDLVLVPILLPYGIEKADVVDAICGQVTELSRILG